jgi:opacity protein-like surface antigen
MFKRISLFTLALLSCSAFAGAPLERVNNQVSGAIVQQKFEYYEIDSHNATSNWWLDSEKGNQAGVAGKLSMQGELAGVRDLFFELEIAHFGGDTAYDGYLQGGQSLVPYKTTTKLKVDDYQVKLGKGFSFGQSARYQLTPYATFGAFDWLRDSSSDPYGYAERYKHQFMGVGLKAQAELSPSVVLTVDVMQGHTQSPSMTLVADGTKYALSTKTISTAAIGADYAVTPQWHLSAEYRVTKFEYGESAVINSMLEPSSKTQRDQLLLGLGYSWR